MSEAFEMDSVLSSMHNTLDEFSPEQDLVRRSFLGRIALEKELDWENPSGMSMKDIEARFEAVNNWVDHRENSIPESSRGHIYPLRGMLNRIQAGYSKVDFKADSMPDSSYRHNLDMLHGLIGLALQDYRQQADLSESMLIRQVAKPRLQPFLIRGDTGRKAAMLAARTDGWSDDQIKSAFNVVHPPKLHTTKRPRPNPPLRIAKPPLQTKPEGSATEKGHVPPWKTLAETSLNSARKPKSEMLTPEREVELAKTIEAGVFAEKLLSDLAQTSEDTIQVGQNTVTKAELELLVKEKKVALFEFLDYNEGLIKKWIVNKWSAVAMSGLDRGNIPDLTDDIKYNERRGLLHAVHKFDHTKGYKFSTFASPWIINGLYDALGARQAIPVHGQIHQSALNVRRAWKRIGDIPPEEWTPAQRAFMDNRDPELAAQAVGDIWLAGKKRLSVYKHLRNNLNYQFTNADDILTSGSSRGGQGIRRIDTIHKPDLNATQDVGRKLEVEQALNAALAHLTDREQIIVTNLFGLGNDPALTSEEMCHLYQWHPTTFNAWRLKALEKMRPYLETLYPTEEPQHISGGDV